MVARSNRSWCRTQRLPNRKNAKFTKEEDSFFKLCVFAVSQGLLGDGLLA